MDCVTFLFHYLFLGRKQQCNYTCSVVLCSDFVLMLRAFCNCRSCHFVKCIEISSVYMFCIEFWSVCVWTIILTIIHTDLRCDPIGYCMNSVSLCLFQVSFYAANFAKYFKARILQRSKCKDFRKLRHAWKKIILRIWSMAAVGLCL